MNVEPLLAPLPAATPYATAFEHYTDELDKLERLLALRAIENDPSADPRALEQALDELQSAQRSIDERIAASAASGRLPPLPWLRRRFGLSAFEEQSLLLCLAPELVPAFGARYRERCAGGTALTVRLHLDVLSQSALEGWRAREALEHGSLLLRWRLLERTPAGSESGLGDSLRLDPGVLRFLLGMRLLDPRLVEVATLELPPPATGLGGAPPAPPWDELACLIGRYVRAGEDGGSALVVHLVNEARSGLVEPVRRICREVGCGLIRLDATALDRHDADLDLWLVLALRDSYLRQAPLLLEGLERLASERALALMQRTARAAECFGWLILLDGGPALAPQQRGSGLLWRQLDVPRSSHATRARQWRRVIAPGAEAELWADELAARFRFEPEQIQEASSLLGIDQLAGRSGQSLEDWYRVCRAQAAPRLGDVGRLLAPRYRLDDLVLPERKLAQLAAICQSVRQHARVFEGWGFDRIIAHGRAVSALLVGPPGTGKTMAAEAIAAELQLDVCKVDLSGVVSKYIGETEQRLALVFREAWAANAVLLFDEADALFGKRTEINDARDRYANIETSYLLQRIEDYEGIVLLATNFRDNLDEAFLRRLRFVVEFPSPDEALRAELWRRHLPSSAPLASDVDVAALARRFDLAGGNIRNIALRAALLAAEHAGPIAMEHLLAAGLEEFEKIGKSWVSR